MKSTIAVILIVLASFPAFALSESDCKQQAISATDAVRWVASGEMPVDKATQKEAQDRLIVIEKKLSEGKYCEARQLAMFRG